MVTRTLEILWTVVVERPLYLSLTRRGIAYVLELERLETADVGYESLDSSRQCTRYTSVMGFRSLVYGQSRFNVSQWSNELARSGKHSSRDMHEGCRWTIWP